MAAAKKSQRRKVTGSSISLKDVIQRIRRSFRQAKPSDIAEAISTAMRIVSSIKKKKKLRPVRVIKIPKTGGILPLIPIFAGLSALGALSGGAAGIAKAVSDTKAAKQALSESHRHNIEMEKIALKGKGLYLKPHKSGLGLFLEKKNANSIASKTIKRC